ncbi:MAG: hypothetical protein PHO90_02435 [Candidatus Pacebacteria bacterium]|nr:hypothetical protein [Candidatus Paceibacterota bacterium]
MNKLFVIVLVLVFFGLTCFAGNGFDWSFLDSLKERMLYLKDWFLSGAIKEEFKRELLGLKEEIPLLFQQVWAKIKDFSI